MKSQTQTMSTNRLNTKTPEELTSDSFCPCTDMGNGERLIAKFGAMLRYSYQRNRWLHWTGTYWHWDTQGFIDFLAKETVKSIYGEAEDAQEKERRMELARWALSAESGNHLDLMTKRAQSDVGIPVMEDDLDRDIMLFNCQNGTIDLKTGKMKEHDPADMITKLVPIDYDPDAECPMWEKFLNDTTDGDTDLQDYLQLIFGVCLTGDMLDQVFFFIYGLGQNGKSTFTTVLLDLMGDYGMRVDSNLFLEVDSGKGATEALANIKGKRVIVSSEVPEGRHLNTGLLKDLAGGGEALRARRLYEHEIQFKPQCKIVMFGNYKPTVKESTLALWRRLKLVPFAHTVEDKDRDWFLGQKLLAELPGILAWAVKGCLNWQAIRFVNEPSAVSAATLEYRSDEFLLADFLEDSCELGAALVVDQAGMKKAYHKWCEANSTKPLGPKKFATRLTERGCQKDHVKKVRSWVGITLKEES